MTSVEQVLAKIASDEGGVKDIGDGKGVTHYGQTLDWLNSYGLPIPTSPQQAMSNWSVWLAKTKLDQLFLVDYDEFAHIVVDYAVHSGASAAIKALQRALGFTGKNVDGSLGKMTFGAVARSDRFALAHWVIADAVEFEGSLITGNPVKYAGYAAGWANRLARMIRNLGGTK